MKRINLFTLRMAGFLAFAFFLLPTLNAQDESATTASISNVTPVEEPKEVIEMPRFPGCEAEESLSSSDRQRCAEGKLLEFIANNIQYPKRAAELGIEGTVVVQFVIDKSGEVRDEHVIRDIGEGCGQEALRIVALMREENIQWIPGKKDGEAVNVQFNLPVLFRFKTGKERREKRRKNKKSKH